jgi:uncharacterized membrane protein YfcA
MRDADVRKRILWIAASPGAALMIVSFAFVRGLIPPHLLAWICIALAVAGYIVFYQLFKRTRDETPYRSRTDDSAGRADQGSLSLKHQDSQISVGVFSVRFGIRTLVDARGAFTAEAHRGDREHPD